MRRLLRLSFSVAVILLLIDCERVKNPGDIEYEVNHWPDVKTLEINDITDTSATLNAAVNAFNLQTIVTFEYGTTTSYGNIVIADQSPVSGFGLTNVSANISGLLPYATYHFRVKAENSIWKNFYSSDKTFNLSDLSLPISVIQDTTLIQNPQVTIEYFDNVYIEYTNGGGQILSYGICVDTCRYLYHEKRNMVQNWTCSPPWDNNILFFNLKELAPGTTYYARAWVIYDIGWRYGEEVMFTTPPLVSPADVFNPDLVYGSVTDIEGNIYRTIQIGTQIWMAENLKTTRYNNGSQIPIRITSYRDGETLINAGVTLSTAACYWYNDDSNYKNLYGALYNYYAVNTGNLCPTGWHVPDNEEWKELEITLGMTQTEADICANLDNSSQQYISIYRGTDQGAQMKAANTWKRFFDENCDLRYGNGTNTSGFSALPAGDVGNGFVLHDGWYSGSTFERLGNQTSWWCSGSPIARTLDVSSSQVGSGQAREHLGFSIRCLKD